MNRIFQAFLFLMVFTSINREFPFPIDLRFFIIILAFLIMGLMLFEQYRNRELNKFKNLQNIKLKELPAKIAALFEKLKKIGLFSLLSNLDKHYSFEQLNKAKYIVLFLFFALVFISNFSWLTNNLELNQSVFISANILYFFNILAITILFLNWKKINVKLTYYYIAFSSFVLLTSMALAFWGFNIYGNSSDAPRALIEDELSIFGVRVGGYAEDANYASLYLILWLLSTLYFHQNKHLKIITILLFIFGYALSLSKTLLMALLFIGLLRILNRKYLYKVTAALVPIAIFLFPIILILFKSINIGLSTLSQRLDMWYSGINLFFQNPLFGSGVTSFRSFFDIEQWYVQSHSTFITILSENGIIAYLLFMVLVIVTFNNLTSELDWFSIILFLSISFTTDTLPFPFIILFVFLIPYMSRKQCLDKQKSLTSIETGRE